MVDDEGFYLQGGHDTGITGNLVYFIPDWKFYCNTYQEA